MILPIDYFSVPEEQWTKDPEFKSRVLAEWEKIPRYEEMGFLKDIALFASAAGAVSLSSIQIATKIKGSASQLETLLIAGLKNSAPRYPQ